MGCHTSKFADLDDSIHVMLSQAQKYDSHKNYKERSDDRNFGPHRQTSASQVTVAESEDLEGLLHPDRQSTPQQYSVDPRDLAKYHSSD